MNRLARALGVARSLVIYYGVPFRIRRMACFYSRFVKPGALCFDIGSHVGNRVRCWRRLGARVVAVEPQANLARVLHTFYGRDANVTIIPAAVGDTEGEAEILVAERTPTVTTLSPEWAAAMGRTASFRRVNWSAHARVPMITLDNLIAQHGMPGFVKIDVEGFERQVLTGLSTPLPALSFEYVPNVRELALACIDRLSELGPYRYNRSQGESHRLAASQWVDADVMRDFLKRLPRSARSGDVYASLDPP
jgi:FkbM family methyltransferase